MTPKLTLSLGLRWEPDSVPTESTESNDKLANQRRLMDQTLTHGSPYSLNKAWKDWGPRFGFAGDPFAGTGNSVLGTAGAAGCRAAHPAGAIPGGEEPGQFLLPGDSVAEQGAAAGTGPW